MLIGYLHKLSSGDYSLERFPKLVLDLFPSQRLSTSYDSFDPNISKTLRILEDHGKFDYVSCVAIILVANGE